MKDLAVIYRSCPSELDFHKPGRPSFFDKEKCYKSFYNSFAHNSDIYVVWDGDKDNRLYELIESTVNIIEIDVKDNKKSLESCYKLAEKLENQYFAFIEDDFLFLPMACQVLIEGLKEFEGHFVFPYDSPHRYNPVYQDVTLGQDYINITKTSHWRTSESLTCSVGMSKKLFENVKPLLYKHCNDGIGSPNDRSFYRECLSYQIRTFTSIPSYCSHMSLTDLSPFIDWSRI